MSFVAMPAIQKGNHQNQGDREYQEDAFGFTPQDDPHFVRHGGFAAVLCDGMGGLEFGAEAAKLSVDTFRTEYRRKLPEETVNDSLQRSVSRANDEVYRFAQRNNVVQRTGCTLVAVVIRRGTELHCIHVGDSRAYVFSRGKLRCLTRDHVYGRTLDFQVQQGQLSQQEADNHPRREHLTSNIGRAELTQVDLLEPHELLQRDDWVLLCSDGLHGILSDAEIAAELHGSSGDAARRLVNKVLASPVPDKDNVTVLILQVQTDGSIKPSHHTGSRPEAIGRQNRTVDQLHGIHNLTRLPHSPLPGEKKPLINSLWFLAVVLLCAAIAVGVWSASWFESTQSAANPEPKVQTEIVAPSVITSTTGGSMETRPIVAVPLPTGVNPSTGNDRSPVVAPVPTKKSPNGSKPSTKTPQPPAVSNTAPPTSPVNQTGRPAPALASDQPPKLTPPTVPADPSVSASDSGSKETPELPSSVGAKSYTPQTGQPLVNGAQ